MVKIGKTHWAYRFRKRGPKSKAKKQKTINKVVRQMSKVGRQANLTSWLVNTASLFQPAVAATTLLTNFIVGRPCSISAAVTAVPTAMENARVFPKVQSKYLHFSLNLYPDPNAAYTGAAAGAVSTEVRIIVLSIKHGFMSGNPVNVAVSDMTLFPLFMLGTAAGPMVTGEFYQKVGIHSAAKALYRIHYDKTISICNAAAALGLPPSPIVHNMKKTIKIDHQVTYASTSGSANTNVVDGEILILAFNNNSTAGGNNQHPPGIEGACVWEYEAV